MASYMGKFFTIGCDYLIYICKYTIKLAIIRFVNVHAKQKHPGCKKVRGQSEAALQTGATKNFDIS